MVAPEKILQGGARTQGRSHRVSGLITPSLDEMAHLAARWSGRNFRCPAHRGATTEPGSYGGQDRAGYGQPVVHVLDASRAVGVVGQLISGELKPAFAARTGRIRRLSGWNTPAARAKAAAQAGRGRARRTPITWSAGDIPSPSFIGERVLDNFPLEELVPFIDWSPFFHTWELRDVIPPFSTTRTRRESQGAVRRRPSAALAHREGEAPAGPRELCMLSREQRR